MSVEDLVKDLRRQVTLLEDDLRVRAAEVPESASALKEEYAEAKQASRTAATYESWLDERVTQVAAAWVLGTVFVRYCEDNGLIAWPFIAGPGERLADAEERHEAYFREHPDHNDRDWVIAAFDHLAAAHPTAAGLFDRKHNPLWEIPPSFEAATALLQFWRRRGDNGEIRYDFTGWDTRFLGDLYQDLSEHARKTYALLQTPEFVEEFILDLTLKPAIEEFGLTGLRTIDPTCGSGHFLLGIFHRLLTRWRNTEPGTELWDLIRRSLASVHGCDKNPFAVSIARFRLLVAVLRSAGIDRLDQAPNFPINIAVGDSLMHGRGASGIQEELFGADKSHVYLTEDVTTFVASCDLLGRSSYHVVVGNPPYIEVDDKREKRNYKDRYFSCHGLWVLTVPFVERFFQLAIRTHGSGMEAGYIGQITGNSFMKREFGKKLIQEYLPTVHLTHIVDTSGAHIPGHGTPTVVLIGRNHVGRKADSIRTVLAMRGEPSQPKIAAKGLVWTAIERQVNEPGSESEWVSVVDSPRERYSKHPWSLKGGGASDLMANLGGASHLSLGNMAARIGFVGMTHADEVMILPRDYWMRRCGSLGSARPIGLGDGVRDWGVSTPDWAFFPYDDRLDLLNSIDNAYAQALWPFRSELGSRRTVSGETYFDEGRRWYEWHQLPKDRDVSRAVLAFAEVATHNHFVVDEGEKLFKQTAPVIKFDETVESDDLLPLLGVLNSSTACFWLKQVCFRKGGSGIGRGIQPEGWMERYAFNASNIGNFPLSGDTSSAGFGKEIDILARRISALEPSAVCSEFVPRQEILRASRVEHDHTRRRMIALQEELDWTVYHSYGLLTDAERAQFTASARDDLPEINLGERAFEIVLARKMSADEVETTWFARHGSMPITKIPAHWPEWYQQVVQARIDVIEKRQDIALIERPDCKRRWATPSWEKKEAEALRTWLLDRCERRDYWFGPRDGFEQPRTLTVNQLADRFRDDQDMHDVARLYATSHLGKPDLTLAQVLEQVIADQHVPYLAALRYKDTGLRKRKQWEQVWDQQREEDRTGQRLDIPVPPKYTSADFRKTSFWSQRGKLDVPKERFISYPDANPDSDPTLLLGWAGWDHADQAQALVNLINDRTADAGWETERLTPLLAGLAEVMPWVHQWHNEYDEDWGGNPAEEYQVFLDKERTTHQLTEADLTNWAPTSAKRGRKKDKQ